MALPDLLELLRGQADEQVRALLDGADREAEELSAAGLRELQEEERRSLEERERSLRREYAEEEARTRRAAREEALRARREELDRIGEGAAAGIEQLEDDPRWPEVARGLARAVRDAGGGRELVVHCRPATAIWVQEAAPELLVRSDPSAEPGLLARSVDGLLEVDARLAVLLDDLFPELEPELLARLEASA